MKLTKLLILLPILGLLNACTAMISNDHGNGYRHNRVSVGVHGAGHGGLGTLIIGGIIGAVINEASHESKAKELEKQKLAEKQAKEKYEEERRLQEEVSQEEFDRRRLSGNAQTTKWYQLGKDQKCYEMQTISGITDVLSSVDANYCKP